ncbi:MAG: D-alanyl-D-alanine carboxypeptidase/D-alanyl-D-alanine-endopeptidase [Bacteroidales bacterium]|jgi:D-alanyl-D-alanine carboxypeptidase/D-alanyl-D-alanine-endopeptidase (penicillin-binding protein 4)|nr:D-alanyl-D-alanine carboxypeptidase/D-alanyl-D-alanine-endopeptidase [Bacteroidales bacterium]
MKKLLTLSLFLAGAYCSAQLVKFEEMLADSLLRNASVSFYVADADNGNVVYSHNPKISLIPASNMKLVSSAAALELLGPCHVFKTLIGYTGELNTSNGQLTGDIIIKGGGDPVLGSSYFCSHYEDFAGRWIEAVKNAGIKKVNGRIITDDSYFDFYPAAPRWLWEDLGASYGAGVFGLSIFDNTFSIRVRTAPDSINVELIDITPDIAGYDLTNRLKTFGSEGKWYLYAAPYSSSGWLSGTIPASSEYVMKVSIPDPPLMAARMMLQRMEKEKIETAGHPYTSRIENMANIDDITYLAQTGSPELRSIMEILNRESVNLYADTFTKELGKQFRNSGTMTDGIKVIMQFLGSAGVDTCGFFIEDGSGLSARNAVNAEGIAKLLVYMRNKGKYFQDYLFSLPEAGQNGTLARFFTDPVFESNLKAKSGSMTRVRCYSGYFTAKSGKNMVFSILVNNFHGTPVNVVRHVEEILKEIILSE